MMGRFGAEIRWIFAPLVTILMASCGMIHLVSGKHTIETNLLLPHNIFLLTPVSFSLNSVLLHLP